MKLLLPALLLTFTVALTAIAQTGPFDPEKLPPTINAAKKVHFVSTDNAFTAPNTNWVPCLKTLTGGDHTTGPVTIGGHTGVKVMGIKFNNADEKFALWDGKHTVDVLMQVYGDDIFSDEKGKMREFNFLTGTLPEPIAVDGTPGGTLPASIKNGKWNWVLFRVPNGLRHMDGGRLIGTIHPKSRGDVPTAGVSRNSGQNGGTIRMDGLHELKVRFVAFGEKGAFGEPEQVNVFSK